jgi:hypothetical protein
MLGGGLNCSNQNEFSYCGQLNALEAFAWIEWFVIFFVSIPIINGAIDRILATLALVVVLIRGISASRRGDGYRGSLV